MYRKRFKQTLILAMCIAILTVIVSAQSGKVSSKFPGSFPVEYIGQVVDENGKPFNGPFEVSLRLFDEPIGGNLFF